MADRAARWMDTLLPRVAVRQVVVTVPWPRLQRVGTVHCLVLDGVYAEAPKTGRLQWHRSRRWATEDVGDASLVRIADRADAWLTRRGYGTGALDEEGEDDADATVFPGAEETCDGVDRNCDGATEEVPGRSEVCAMDSCFAVYEADASAVDGAYWLALPSGTVTQMWCDMAGGGWTLGFLRSSASVGNQGDFGAGEAGLDTLTLSPDAASSSADGALGWMDLNAFAYDELVLTGHAWGETTVRSEAIPRSHLRLSFGEDGYLLYGDPSPYVWCGRDRSYTDGRTGQVDPPEGAPPGCRNYGSLGSGWDFSGSYDANLGLTLSGSDGCGALTST